MSLSQISIGSAADALVNLYDLTVPVRPPLVDYAPGTIEQENMDGEVEDLGSPTAELRWNYLPRTERDSLRTILPTKSTRIYVYIPTTENGDEYKTYHCIAVWPRENRELVTVRTDFVIKLKNLVEVE